MNNEQYQAQEAEAKCKEAWGEVVLCWRVINTLQDSIKANDTMIKGDMIKDHIANLKVAVSDMDSAYMKARQADREWSLAASMAIGRIGR